MPTNHSRTISEQEAAICVVAYTVRGSSYGMRLVLFSRVVQYTAMRWYVMAFWIEAP